MNPDHPLTEPWETRTLHALQQQALQEKSGTAFEALSLEHSPRRMLAVCLTEAGQIAVLEKVIDLDKAIQPVDWNHFTLAELAAQAVAEKGLSYEVLREASGQRVAITLCATSPEMVGLVERFFQVKP